MRVSRFILPFAILAGISGSALATTSQAHQRVEVAFVLDTTGSMGDLIDGAKKKIWSIASTIVDTNPDADIAMSIVAYRDRGDAYVVKSEPLSEDIQGLYGKLVRLEADGGDDTPESVNEALDKAINNLQWSSGSNVKRIVFLVGDAPPHMDYPQERQYPEILKRAVARGITVNTVQAGDMAETTPIWQEIAQFGRGRYMAIPQSGGEVSIIITPYDDDILHMQGELDRSVVPYGDLEQQGALEGKMKERVAASKSTQLENSTYYAKRSKKEVVTGGGDLVSDIANNAVSLDKLAPAALPKELQAVPAPERKAWVAARMDKRKVLEEKITALVVKRDAYAAEQRKKLSRTAGGDSFDEAVAETLKLQLQ
jgi:von Willebrand factor type A domain